MSDGGLHYGPMAYQALLLSSIRSLEPETATALVDFVREGGKLAVIDGIPYRSLSMDQAGEGDAAVAGAFQYIRENHPETETRPD